ncbi:hypothetical protein [Acholeplasma equifetale]|uniref:hypothetical protein n=1 Tax=Acholeplasma equifetale TaxID=264634 RepID=UPI00047992C7|nr:hypothetical protein [Acholeplasma equifetale]
MIKKKIIALLMGLAIIGMLTACGGGGKTPSTYPPTTQPPDETVPDSTTDEIELASYISAAISKLDELVKPVIEKISDEDLKAAIKNYYDTEKQYVNGIKNLETAKSAANKVVEDTKVFAKDTLKPLAIQKLNGVINPLIEKITYEELKNSVQSFYNTEMAKIDAIETLAEVSDTFKEILDNTKAFISTETEKVIIALKNKALEELDPYVTVLIAKIPYDTLKTDTQAFYNEVKKKLEAVDTIEGFEPCVKEIKDDLEEYALTETKKIAIAKLQEVVDAGIAKIPNPVFKEDLTEFSKTEIAKLNAVTAIEDVPTTLTTVITETEAHIQGLLVNTVKEYVARLTAIETATAYDYLPAAMHPSYSNNVVDASSINYDFTSFTNVTIINQAGYGEQWQMVVENINQSVAMAKVFNVAQTALNAAGNAVDIYITNSYSEEMSYTFSGNGYTGKFEFKDAMLIFNITLTDSVTVPGFGSVKPVIKMEYDLTKEAKGMFISLGDSYKVKYIITENGYEMATTYGLTIAGKSASRSSYLSIVKNNGKTTGHIYEYITYEGSDKIKACADFYVENGYVSVVGNKSSGMTGFDGYINELYSANEGRLLGYEVREELTYAGVTGTYNTLWFNLWDIQGINSVKVTDKTDANKSGKSTVDVYLNGSSTLLSPTYNTIFSVKTSRKYDIEFRTRYYYTYDAETGTYVSNAVQVPMMFVQEGDNYNSFSSDMLKDNGVTVSVSLSQTHLNKILSDYDTLIDIFIANKDAMTSETIIAYLEQYE